VNIAIKYRDRVDASLMLPQVNWRETAQRPPPANEHDRAGIVRRRANRNRHSSQKRKRS